MTEKQKAIYDHFKMEDLYTVDSLQKALFSNGYSIPKNILYDCLKCTGWIKLRLIRDRLLDTKRQIPKHSPFDAFRHLIKYPLLVDRNADLPEWEER